MNTSDNKVNTVFAPTEDQVKDAFADEKAEVENQISGEQEQLLNTEGTVESVLDPTLVDAADTYENIKAQHEAGEISDDDLLFAVSDGSITEDQFVEIRGLPSAEVQTLVNAEPEVKEPMYSLDAAKEKILNMQKESNGKLSNAGALAVVQAWHMRNEVSEATLKELAKLLVPDNGSNNPPDTFTETLNEMKAYYKPTLSTLEDCKKAAENITGVIIHRNIELEGTQVSRLIQVFSDIAYHLAQKGELTLARRGEADVTLNKPYTGITHQVLWNAIKKGKMLGDVKEATGEKMGDRVKHLGKIYDPYSDPSLSPQIPNICKRAVLFAFGHSTKVQFGYMPKRSANGRPSKLTIFESAVDDEKGYFKNLCIPQNVVMPLKNQVIEKITAVSSTEVTGLKLVGGESNDNESLIWVSHDILEPLYQHLHGHELDYYLVDETNSGIPTGAIIGSHDPRFPPGAQVRESSAKALERTKAELTKASTERDAALKGIEKENRLGTLQALEAYVGNKNMPIDEKEPYHAFNLALVMLNRLTGNGRKPSQDDLKMLLVLKRAVDLVIEDDPEGKPMYKSPNGDLRTPIAA